jgi:hypothetical protein
MQTKFSHWSKKMFSSMSHYAWPVYEPAKLVKTSKKREGRGWRLLSLVAHYTWPVYETIRTSVVWPYEHLRYDPLRRSLIEGKRVLIIGSGPSASELEEVANDMVILTCKRALKIFEEKKINRPIDLFLCCKNTIHKNGSVEDLLQKIKTNLFVMDDLNYTRHRNKLKGSYAQLIPDDGKDNFYLKRLIEPHELREFERAARFSNGSSKTLKHVSSGVRLLQYALYFKAKEIYLIGLDLNNEGYFWGEPKKQKHLEIDHFFINVISKKYKNVYSLSPTSPILKYFPHKLFSRTSG